MTVKNSTFSSDPPSRPLLPNLPDDVAVQSIARVPLSHHPTLSLVSKAWLSTVHSPLLFTTRSLLHCTQNFLYLNLRIGTSMHWYILHLNPNPKSPRLLFRLPPIPFQPKGASVAVLGPRIYVIGGSINDIPSGCIWVFDCRFNKWEIGPKMMVGREFPAAGAANGKIFVMGGREVDNWAQSMNWSEVFDPVIGSWTALPSPTEVRDNWMRAGAVVDGKMYAMVDSGGGVVYDALAGEWGGVSNRLDLGWRGQAAEVEGVLYCYNSWGKIRGYDVEEGEWKELKGVEKDFPKFLGSPMVVNVNGGLCLVWQGKWTGEEVEIMCTEIEVQKDSDGELNGSIVGSNVILGVPAGSSIVHCVSVPL